MHGFRSSVSKVNREATAVCLGNEAVAVIKRQNIHNFSLDCTEWLQNSYRTMQRGQEAMGEIKDERKWQREKPTGCSLTFLDVVAAAAVIFPSGGNKVTLACVRTGDRRSGRLQRRRRPLLTRVGVSRGDRSEKLLTGGPWHHTAPAPPRDAASAHFFFFQGKLEWRSYPFPSSPIVLLLYFVIPLTPMWKTDRDIKYWYDLVCLILHFAVRV